MDEHGLEFGSNRNEEIPGVRELAKVLVISKAEAFGLGAHHIAELQRFSNLLKQDEAVN